MNKKIGYFPQLDAIRAIAVIMTLCAHYLSRVGFHEVPYLWLGVDVFFVLSGFLITGILLNTKPVYGKERLKAIKNFFIRRALRLFPAYYLLIIVFWAAFNFAHLYIWENDYNRFFFFYTPNWFFFLHPEKASGSFNHMWSLGVEEQFYLLWPWVILFLPVRYLKFLLPGIIIFSIGVIAIFSYIPKIGMLPFCNFHTLGAGALLAYFYFKSSGNSFYLFIVKRRELLFALLFTALLTVLIFMRLSLLKGILRELLVSTVTVLFILCSVMEWRSPVKYFTKNRLVQYIGRISYGIYLYHMPIPDTIKAVAGHFGKEIDYTKYPYLSLTVFFGLALLIASLSYRFLEKPFLLLKEKWAR